MARWKSAHAISLGININLVWGLILLVFGVLMLLGRRQRRQNPAVRLILCRMQTGELALGLQSSPARANRLSIYLSIRT